MESTGEQNGALSGGTTLAEEDACNLRPSKVRRCNEAGSGQGAVASRWKLAEDACVGAAAKVESMEDAGKWMFNAAMEGEEMTDMEFVLDSGRRIRGHRVWLMARCAYIRGMLSSGMREATTGIVRVRECSDAAFIVLLEFLYTGRLGRSTCQGQDWEELLGLADIFGAKGMEDHLLDAVTFNNVEQAARVGVRRDMSNLLERCMEVLPVDETSEAEALRVMRVMHVICDSWLYMEEIDDYGIFPVISAMGNHIDTVRVQEDGCKILETIVHVRMHGMNLDSMVPIPPWFDMIEVLVDAMHATHWLSRVQSTACWTLRVIIRESASRCERAGEVGAVEVVVEAMLAHTNDVNVQTNACMALGALVEGDEENQRRAFEVGGVLALVMAMQAHTCDANMQGLACRVLRSFVRTDVHRRHAKTVGAIDAIAQAIMSLKHLQASRFTRQVTRCLKTLPFLAFDGDQNLFSGETLLVNAVLEALETYIMDGSVQAYGCEVLRLLVFDDVNRRKAVEGKGIEAVIEAMSRHASSPSLQTEASMTLKAFCNQSGNKRGDSYKKRMVKAGGIAVIVEAILKHRYNAKVLISAFDALEELVKGVAEYKDMACRDGALIRDIVLGMNAHVSDADLQASGCRALAVLIETSATYRKMAGDHSAVSSVIQGLETHSSDGVLLRSGCHALLCLVEHDHGNRRAALLHAKGVDVVLQVLSSITLDEQPVVVADRQVGGHAQEIAGSCCRLLSLLSSQHLPCIGRSAVDSAMARYPSDQVVQEYGQMALSLSSMRMKK